MVKLVAQVSLEKRLTLGSLPFETIISIGTVYSVLKEKELERVNSSVKFYRRREQDPRTKVCIERAGNRIKKLQEMFNIVQLDEK